MIQEVKLKNTIDFDIRSQNNINIININNINNFNEIYINQINENQNN